MNLDPLRPYADLIRWVLALLVAGLLAFDGTIDDWLEGKRK